MRMALLSMSPFRRGPLAVMLLLLVLLGMGPAARAEEAEEIPEGKGIHPAFAVKNLPDAATSVALDPTGKTVAVGSYDVVELWNLSDKKRIAKVPTKSGFVRSLTYSNDGTHLYVGGYQGITPVTVADGTIAPKWKGHRGYVTDLAMTPDGQSLVSCAEDMTVRVWNVADGTERSKLGKFTDPVTGVAVSPDGTLVATTSGDETRLTRPGEIKVWKLATGEAVQTLTPHQKPPTEVTFSPDGKFLATTSFDERVNVYDVETGKALGFFGGHQRPSTCVAFFPDSQRLVSGCGGRFQGGAGIRVWTRDEGEVVDGVDFETGKVTDLALSADGKRLAVALDTKQAIVYEVEAEDVRPKAEGRNGGQSGSGGVVVVPAETLPRSLAHAAASPFAAAQEDKAAKPATQEKPETEEKAEPPKPVKPIKIGLIGLDTSHSVAFTTVLNSAKTKPGFEGCRIVAAYPWGSRDIESSKSRIPEYTKKVEELGVKVVDSIDDLLPMVDCVLLETNDGRPHLEQALKVFKAGKPVFIDKPVAGSLVDCLAIYQAAKEYNVPMFSSSSLRFIPESLKARAGEFGKVFGCDAFSPCSLEATHPDLFWYGIHGCEILYTVMGSGCETVTRASTNDADFVTGVWKEGRIGTFRGIRGGKAGYGGTVFGEKQAVPLGNFKGYEPLIVEIVAFFRTGQPPVAPEETIELYAFMEAADESKRQGGKPVSVKEVLEKAQAQVKARLDSLR